MRIGFLFLHLKLAEGVLVGIVALVAHAIAFKAGVVVLIAPDVNVHVVLSRLLKYLVQIPLLL